MFHAAISRLPGWPVTRKDIIPSPTGTRVALLAAADCRRCALTRAHDMQARLDGDYRASVTITNIWTSWYLVINGSLWAETPAADEAAGPFPTW